MSLNYYNPFQQAEIRVPEHLQDELSRYSRTFTGGAGRPNPENSPFERYIDIWMLGVCLGAVEALRAGTIPESEGVKWHRFITGAIFQGDTTRIELLELLAVALTGDPFVVSNPRRVIDIANNSAAQGLPAVFEMLQAGQGKPLWNVTHHLLQALRGSSATRSGSGAGGGEHAASVPTAGGEEEQANNPPEFPSPDSPYEEAPS